MENTRRDFIRQSSSMGLILFLAPQLIACKSKTPKEMENIISAASSKYNFSTSGSETYTIKNLAGNLWTFEEKGGTIGFYVSEDSIVIVDTQFPEQSTNLVEQIRKSTDRKIDLLINTHHHGDHTSGNPVFKDIIHDSVAHVNSLKNQRSNAEKKGNIDAQFFPVLSFENDWERKIGEETVRMKFYGAGHTDGDAVTTFLNTNAVHMGDLVFNRRFPYIDKSAGANVSNWVNILDQVIKDHNDETKYIFGHADNGHLVTGSSEDLRAFQNYLEKLIEFANTSIKSGKSLDDVKKETKIIPGAEEWKGDGIERSLDAIYNELT